MCNCFLKFSLTSLCNFEDPLMTSSFFDDIINSFCRERTSLRQKSISPIHIFVFSVSIKNCFLFHTLHSPFSKDFFCAPSKRHYMRVNCYINRQIKKLSILVQGVSKKRYFLGFRHISVLVVRFYFLHVFWKQNFEPFSFIHSNDTIPE